MSMPELRTVRTRVLEIAYEEAGPPGGEPVLLLHGWPDSVRTWDAVVPALAGEGYRCLAPYLRGFGPTRFTASSTPRSGQAMALAQDAKDFADTLGLDRFILVGHDWGGFASYLVTAIWPERVFASSCSPWDTQIRVPTRVLHGADDACVLPETTERKESSFAYEYARRLLPGVGHFPQREQPEAVIEVTAR